MQAIIRDDDTSFFTSAEMLKAVYGQAWRRGMPVCLSITPAQATVQLEETYIRERLGSSYDLNAPPAYRGTSKTFTVNSNRDLCSFLNEKIEEGLVDVAIHGYSHSTEFKSENRDDVNKALAKSVSLLRSCFPSASLSTFVPPYELLSSAARSVLLESGYNISTSYESFIAEAPLKRWKYRIRRRLVSDIPRETVELRGDSKIFFGLYLFLPELSASECFDTAIQRFDECRRRGKTFVCVNHYWHFFRDWREPREELLRAWFDFVEYTRSLSDVTWTTFEKWLPEGA